MVGRVGGDKVGGNERTGCEFNILDSHVTVGDKEEVHGLVVIGGRYSNDGFRYFVRVDGGDVHKAVKGRTSV